MNNKETHSAIRQGNLYWINPSQTEIGQLGFHRHPYVIIQDDLFNQSRIHTVVVCALTSNINLANEPGNVLLNENEGGLSQRSVVVVSKISSVKKKQLSDFIGTLSLARIQKILAGIRFQQTAFFKK